MKAGHSNDRQVLENVPVNTVVLTLVTTRYTEAFKQPLALIRKTTVASHVIIFSNYVNQKRTLYLSKSSTFCLVFMFMISVLFTENIFSVISVVKGQSKTDCVAAIYCTVYSVQCAGTSGFYGICVNRITSLSVAAQLDTNKNLLTVV